MIPENSNQKIFQRDKSIDVLRFLALCGIIIAHVVPSKFWYQLREFDVPMMVFLSGLCFTYGKYDGNYKSYVWKRFKRLIIPAWTFLFIYTLFIILLGLKSYSFINLAVRFSFYSDWYTWIIRVFFIMALISPFILKISHKVTLKKFWFGFFALLVVNEVLGQLSKPYYPLTVLEMIIGWGLVLALGMVLPRLNKKSLAIFTVINILIFSSLAIYYFVKLGYHLEGESVKWPPTIYYLSYAFGAIGILWLLKDYITFILRKLKVLNFCTYIGRHTLWIYLWHIPFNEFLYDVPMPKLFKFLIIYAGGLLLAWLQTQLIDIISKKIKSEKTKKELQLIFCS